MTFKAKLTTLTLGAALATTVATAALGQGMRFGPMVGPFEGSRGKAIFQNIDTNGDKLLSPNEIRAYEASQIKGLDANGDGFLTADEIAAKMTEMSKARLTAWATRMANRFGKDGKVSVDAIAKIPLPFDRVMQRMLKVGGGKVSQATFEAVEVMGGFGRQDHAVRWRGHDGAMGEHGPRGRMADRGYGGQWGVHDHSGWMGDHGSRGWMSGRGDRGRPGPMDRRQGRMGAMGSMIGGWATPKFSEIDANHDGSVTAAEYQAYKLDRVKAMDANGDGFITPKEFADYVTAKAEPRIKQRADNLVKRLDLNGDGKLSIEEVAAAPFDMMFAHLPTDKNGNVTEQAFLRMRGPDGWQGHGHRGGWHDRGRGGQGWGGMMPPPVPDAPQGN